jgi:membrane protein required for colicin V production
MIIDVILALVLVWAVFQGLKRGLIDQIAMLLGLWFGVWLSFTFSEALVKWIDVEISNSVMFVILFAVGIALAFLCSFVARKLAKNIGLGIVDKIGGVLFSLVSYTLLLSLLLGIFRDVNTRMEFIDDKEFEKSILIEPIEKVADAVFPYVKGVKDLAVESFD